MSAGIKKWQVIRIQTSMKQHDREERLHIISEVIGREIKTVKGLSKIEANNVLHYLVKGQVVSDNWAFFDKDKFVSERKLLWSYLYQAQWTTPHEIKNEVPDLERLSNFLKSSKSPVNKPLKEWNKTEWSKILQAFRNIVKGTYK